MDDTNSIHKSLAIPAPAGEAFNRFVHQFRHWWPKEYTWSQQKLRDIFIEPEEGGLCTEIGPHGFRCDWGRVIKYSPPVRIAFKWQIGFDRDPLPDPDKASEVVVDFIADGIRQTTVELHHRAFPNHGEHGDAYRQLMDSTQGWEYILACYKRYCEQVME
jgi:uncharacterized protein YndB with AHSA1/START domain